MSLKASVWQECAARLIETGELDPVYTMLCGARDNKVVDETWLSRFCLYHLMFYDVKRAIEVATSSRPFWPMVLERYDDCRRGQERRHFRGENGMHAIESMKRGQPLEILHSVYHRDYRSVYYRISNLYSGFGPYFALKWADYLDVVFKRRIDFKWVPTLMFDGAAEALKHMFPDFTVTEGMEEIVAFISNYDTPFDGTRKCGMSEAETIACGVKVYCLKSTFKFGYDVRHLHETLKEASESSLVAGLLVDYIPKWIPE